TRALISAACATAIDGGLVDLESLIETVSKGEPIIELPRERYFSLVRGMQLLVDISENLVPFDRDLREFVRQLQLVIGKDRSEVLYFADCPTFGCGPEGRSTWKRASTPP